MDLKPRNFKLHSKSWGRFHGPQTILKMRPKFYLSMESLYRSSIVSKSDSRWNFFLSNRCTLQYVLSSMRFHYFQVFRFHWFELFRSPILSEPPSRPHGPLTSSDVERDSVTLHWSAPDRDGGASKDHRFIIDCLIDCFLLISRSIVWLLYLSNVKYLTEHFSFFSKELLSALYVPYVSLEIVKYFKIFPNFAHFASYIRRSDTLSAYVIEKHWSINDMMFYTSIRLFIQI